MLVTIKNEKLSVVVDTLGAQLMNICSADGTEYLWQGDSTYWPDRSPLLFPFVARLTNNSYRLNGKVYPMEIHGFARKMQFAVLCGDETSAIFVLQSNEESRQSYPFDFSLSVTYALEGSSVKITYGVENRSETTMPFGIGGHPGFRVPLVEGENYEDYCLEFSAPCQPNRVGFSRNLYLNGKDALYPLEDGKRIPLHHELFDADAIVLRNMAKAVTLRSQISGKGVTVSYPDMPYVGFWHCPQSDAPYVCIEPWSTLPSREGVVEDFAFKSDMIRLAPGGTYENNWTVTIF